MNHSQVILSTVHCKYPIIPFLAYFRYLVFNELIWYLVDIYHDIDNVHSYPRMSKITDFYYRIYTPRLLQYCSFLNIVLISFNIYMI